MVSISIKKQVIYFVILILMGKLKIRSEKKNLAKRIKIGK
jgi:hypothetical protein